MRIISKDLRWPENRENMAAIDTPKKESACPLINAFTCQRMGGNSTHEDYDLNVKVTRRSPLLTATIIDTNTVSD
jgi:hypothetical protein